MQTEVLCIIKFFRSWYTLSDFTKARPLDAITTVSILQLQKLGLK